MAAEVRPNCLSPIGQEYCPLERSALHRSSQHAASANAARCMWHRTALRFLPQKAEPAEGALWNKKDNT